MKVTSSKWFGKIGIVRLLTDEGTVEYRIGEELSNDKKRSEEYIANNGSRIDSEELRKFFEVRPMAQVHSTIHFNK